MRGLTGIRPLNEDGTGKADAHYDAWGGALGLLFPLGSFTPFMLAGLGQSYLKSENAPDRVNGQPVSVEGVEPENLRCSAPESRCPYIRQLSYAWRQSIIVKNAILLMATG